MLMYYLYLGTYNDAHPFFLFKVYTYNTITTPKYVW